MKFKITTIMNQAKFFLFSFIFLAFQANTQAQTKHYYQIMGGLGVTKEQCFRDMSFYEGEGTLGWRISALYCNQEEGDFTYKTGLSFISVGDKYNFVDLTFWTNTLESIKSIIRNNMFLEIPFLLHFDFRQNKKWTSYGEIGLAGNIPLRTNTKQIYNDGRVVKSSGKGFSSSLVLLPSAIANVGFQYEYKPSQYLFLQPSFTLVTTKLNRNVFTHSNLYLFNLEVGARYAL